MTGYGGGEGTGDSAGQPGGSGGGAGIDSGAASSAIQPAHPSLPFNTKNFGNDGGKCLAASPYCRWRWWWCKC